MEELVVTAKWRHLAPIVAPNGAKFWRMDLFAKTAPNWRHLAPKMAPRGAKWRTVAIAIRQNLTTFGEMAEGVRENGR